MHIKAKYTLETLTNLDIIDELKKLPIEPNKISVIEKVAHQYKITPLLQKIKSLIHINLYDKLLKQLYLLDNYNRSSMYASIKANYSERDKYNARMAIQHTRVARNSVQPQSNYERNKYYYNMKLAKKYLNEIKDATVKKELIKYYSKKYPYNSLFIVPLKYVPYKEKIKSSIKISEIFPKLDSLTKSKILKVLSDIEVKNYDVNEVLEFVVKFYGKQIVNRSSNPPEVWVKGAPKIEKLNIELRKNFNYYGMEPKATILRQDLDENITVISVGTDAVYINKE